MRRRTTRCRHCMEPVADIETDRSCHSDHGNGARRLLGKGRRARASFRPNVANVLQQTKLGAVRHRRRGAHCRSPDRPCKGENGFLNRTFLEGLWASIGRAYAAVWLCLVTSTSGRSRPGWTIEGDTMRAARLIRLWPSTPAVDDRRHGHGSGIQAVIALCASPNGRQLWPCQHDSCVPYVSLIRGRRLWPYFSV